MLPTSSTSQPFYLCDTWDSSNNVEFPQQLLEPKQETFDFPDVKQEMSDAYWADPGNMEFSSKFNESHPTIKPELEIKQEQFGPFPPMEFTGFSAESKYSFAEVKQEMPVFPIPRHLTFPSAPAPLRESRIYQQTPMFHIAQSNKKYIVKKSSSKRKAPSFPVTINSPPRLLPVQDAPTLKPLKKCSSASKRPKLIYFLENKLILEQWKDPENQAIEMPKNIEIPPFSFSEIVSFAYVNSPHGNVTSFEVFAFILHHFPYYRFVDKNIVKRKIASALSDKRQYTIKKNFENGKQLDSRRYTANTDFEDTFKKLNSKNQNADFFNGLTKGTFGLPRLLFYYIIGSFAPQYAGPENSALFYHMISIGKLPEKFSDLFRIHQNAHQNDEPKFFEENRTFDVSWTRRPNCWPSYQVNGLVIEDIDDETCDFFHNKTGLYFELQKKLQAEGAQNWMTPSLRELV